VLPDPLLEGVYALPFAPFSQVYPRCAAVIHHGGNYTAGEALRAGIPALVVPWGIDLFFSAAQVKRIGAGLWVHTLFYTPKVAERMLRTVLEEPCYRAEAQAAATHITQEDGVATLCGAIEAILQHSLSSSAR
jgi:rhamnosyltransferase subunit B